MEQMRLEPSYITKYGKEYHELYHANIEVYNREMHYKKNRYSPPDFHCETHIAEHELLHRLHQSY